MSRFHIAVGVAVAAGLVVLYGCAALEQPPTAPAVTVTAQPVDPDPTDPEVPGDAGDTTAPEPTPVVTETPRSVEPSPSTAPTDQPVAVRPGSINEIRVKTSVFPVRRSGQTVSVNVLIESRDTGEPFILRGELNDGDLDVVSDSRDAVDGLRLIDTKNKKMHLPATTGDGVCACTPADDRGWKSETAVWVSVVFAAPPADVTAVDVSVPGFGTVANVPVV